MKRYGIFILPLLLFCVVVSPAEPLFRTEKLSDRVLLLIEQSPMQNIIAAIATSRGILMIDTGPSVETTSQARDLIGKHFNRSDILWVIHTHAHWDHVFGSQVFRGAQFIGHEQTAQSIRDSSRSLSPLKASFERTAADVRTRLAEMPASHPERSELVLQGEFAARNLKGMQSPGFQLVPLTITFNDRMTLQLGDLTVRLLHFGRAHSTGDIFLHIPEEGLLFTGDLFLDQKWLPLFAGLRTLQIPRWIEVLNDVLQPESAVRRVIPGHHGTWPREKLVLWRDYIVQLWQAVQAAVKEGKSLEEFSGQYPLPASCMYLKDMGHTKERLQRFHEGNIRAFWRQLVPSPLQEIEMAILQGGADAAEKRFQEIQARTKGTSFDEKEMNQYGYELLANGKLPEAIAVLRMNVALFPKSANVYDSLGEALAEAGKFPEALQNYRQVLTMDPENPNAKKKLKELQERIRIEK